MRRPAPALKVCGRRSLRSRRGRRLPPPCSYLPDPAPSLAPEADKELAATGLGNPVTAVLIAYRSFDTMLEKIVLVLAVVGVWSVAPDRFWGGAPGAARPRGAGRRAASSSPSVLAPLGIVVGVHMFWVGADEPGGAFQGGAILAAMWMIVMMARADRAAARRRALAAACADRRTCGVPARRPRRTAAWPASFFAYPAGFAKPIILFIEAFMVLTIAVDPADAGRGPAEPGGRTDERGDARRTGRRGAGRPRPLRPHRQPAAAAQAARLQPDRQRRLPGVRHRRAARRGGRLSLRSRAAGDGDHRHRGGVRGERARGRADAPARRGDRAASRSIRTPGRSRTTEPRTP